MRYNPKKAPDPKKWNTAGEMERLVAVEHSHKKNMPKLRLHASIHMIVENQVALGDETPVQETLARLQAEGLERHDAVHAIGSILAEHMYDIMKDGANDDVNKKYFSRIKELTAKNWRAQADEGNL